MIIGILDSGLGGLTTLRELIKAEISDYFIYYADNANSPYGTKTAEQIEKCVKEACRVMLKRGAEIIVLACNTATSSVIRLLRKELPVPVFGLEPAIRPAMERAGRKVLVLATEFTLNGEKWRALTEDLTGEYEVKALPQLAALIDRDYPFTREISAYIERELCGYNESVDRVVLGCTHYVLVSDLIKNVINNAGFFDGNKGLARFLGKLFPCSAKGINVDLIFSGEKQYQRYADILTELVQKPD
ncbi:MAG: glutamate racemase [Clostridia bacterium]|nr:glutamate racemase [Clostridia bacterium]